MVPYCAARCATCAQKTSISLSKRPNPDALSSNLVYADVPATSDGWLADWRPIRPSNWDGLLLAPATDASSGQGAKF